MRRVLTLLVLWFALATAVGTTQVRPHCHQ